MTRQPLWLAGEQAAHAAADTWRSTTGRPIEALIGELRGTFPDLPSIASTDPNTAFRTAATRIDAELQRCSRAIADDDALVAQVERLNQAVEQSRARVALADEQLASITGEAEGLSRALASIIPHIHGDDCPVCGRNYHEVSGNPLVQHVSTQVARLTEQADRLQALGVPVPAQFPNNLRPNATGIRQSASGKRQAASGLAKMGNPVQCGHRFQRKADSNPVIADSR
jgi:hypothetical protein